MKKFLLAILCFILGVIAIFLGAFYFFFNTAIGFEALAKTSWKASRSPVALTRLSVEKVRTLPWKEIEISNVQMTLLAQKQPFHFSAKQMGLEFSPRGWSEPPIFWMKEAAIRCPQVSFLNVNLKLGLRPHQATPTGFGGLLIEKITVQKKYFAEEIAAVIHSLSPLQLKPVAGMLLDGTLRGEIEYDLPGGRLRVRGRLENASMARLAEMLHIAFQNTRGRFQSDVLIITKGSRLLVLEANLSSPSPGGEMNAELFQILIRSIPGEADRKRILDLIRLKNAVPYDEARLQIKKISETSFGGRFIFESKAMSLRLDLELEINFEDPDFLRALSAGSK
ncbi:MAG: hypothetical protein HY586_07465 [Candidatus Omnitrophica bacterium]|nr:hypothetical protein [Candidatus Omnitrophota bacterium]